jgi:phosphate-selective porin OprO/OprP
MPSDLKARQVVFATVSMICLSAFTASAWAQDASPPDTSSAKDLQAQVRALTRLVQAQSQKDQAEIQSLSEKVQRLESELAQTRVTQAAGAAADNSSSQNGLPRALQNATAHETQPNDGRLASDEGAGLPRVVQNSSHRLALQSGDGQYSIGLTGDVQFDTGDYLSFRPDSKAVGPQALSNGVNARRARIGIAGTAPGGWGFGLVWDAGNSSDQTAKGIETAQIVYGGLHGAAFEIGYSNTFFTLDQATSSNDTLFLERATPSNIATNFNTGDARANAGVRFFGDRYWIGGYLTGPASGDSHTLTAERFGAFERAAFQVLKGRDYTVHLGFGVDQLLQAPNTGNGTADVVTLSDQPELRIDPTTLVSTGTLGTLASPVTGGHVYDLETAATFKNLFWQGELYKYDVSRRGLADADFGGAYGQVSWTLTGESHPYNPQAGAYYRITPRHPFSLTQGGIGAVELAARVSYIDLNSDFRTGSALSVQPAAVDGGRQVGYTLGLNWYPNDIFRMLLDYNHIEFDKANATAVKTAPLGAPVGAQFDALSLRAQVAF